MRLFTLLGQAVRTMMGRGRTHPAETSVLDQPVQAAETEAAASDRFDVAEAALRYLMDRYSSHGVEGEFCSAYVVGGEFASRLVAAFAGHVPRVVAGIDTSTATGEAIDTATGKRVTLWGVDSAIVSDDAAVASVTWYMGILGAGGHSLQLRRNEGTWTVESEQQEWIS